MAEAEFKEKIDISFERQIAETKPGVRQRALAVQALFKLMETLDVEPSIEQVEAIRGLSRKEAMAARKAIEQTMKIVVPGEATAKSNVIILTPVPVPYFDDEMEEAEVLIAEPKREPELVESGPALEAEPEIQPEVEIEVEAVVEAEGVVETETQVEREIAESEVVAEPNEIEIETEIEQEVEVQTELEIEPSVEITNEVAEPQKVEQNKDQLDERAVKFLQAIGYDTDLLTLKDVPLITSEIVVRHAPAGITKFDYTQLVNLYLLGGSFGLIANELGSSEKSIRQTILNLKNKIIKKSKSVNEIPEASVEVEPVELVSEPVLLQPAIVEPLVSKPPVPQPPKTNLFYVTKPVETVLEDIETQLEESTPPEVVDAFEVVEAIEEKPLDLKEAYGILKKAINSPKEVSVSEWEQIAEPYIKTLAMKYINEVEANALWTLLHMDEGGKFNATSRRSQDAIDHLRPRFREVITDRFDRDAINRKILGLLFGNNNGENPKNLDDIFNFLESRQSGAWSKNLVQRQAVLAFVELLQP